MIPPVLQAIERHWEDRSEYVSWGLEKCEERGTANIIDSTSASGYRRDVGMTETYTHLEN